MKNKYSWSYIFGFVAMLPILGCVNPYRSNFNSTLTRYPNWLETRLSPKANNPEIVLADDIKSENWKLFESGYIMVGFAKFDGPDQDPRIALSQAKAIGADRVVVQKSYSKTLTETVTVTSWPADETTTIREQSDVSTGRGIKHTENNTEITTSQSPETSYVPQQVDYYEYSATFWRKLARPIFGAVVQDLVDAQKQKLQTNHGLVVRGVMADSPANTADLLKDDIILKIDGNPVPSATKFYSGLSGQAGSTVTLTILRGSETLERKVKLNS